MTPLLTTSLIAHWQATILVWIWLLKAASIPFVGRRGKKWGGGDDIGSHLRR